MTGFNFAPVPANTVEAAITFSASGDNTLVAAGAATQVVRIYRIFLVAAGATNLTFKSGASTSLSGAIPMSANGSIVLDMDGGEPWFTCAAGQAFVLNSSNAVQVSGMVYSTISGF